MKFPVVISEGYQGSALTVDAAKETLSIVSTDGTVLGTVTWAQVIDLAVRKANPPALSTEDVQMIPLALKVRYRAGGTVTGEGLTAEFGGGGFFLETGTPLPVGTELSVEFSLPDQPQHRILSKGRVVRVRQRPERQLFLPGMEIRFMDLAQTDQEQVSALIAALERTRSLPR